MISPSNLPSPAGYSFGSYEPVSKHLATDAADASSLPSSGGEQRRPRSDSPQMAPLSLPAGNTLAFANNNNSTAINGAASLSLSSSTSTLNHPPAASSSSYSAGTGAAAATPSTSFQKSAPAASLSVALCRSLVLKYIYLTYLLLLRLFVLPSTAVQKFVRRMKRRRGERDDSEGEEQQQQQQQQQQKQQHQPATGTGMGVVERVGAVGEQFLQTYTLDNHLGLHSSSSSTTTTTTTDSNKKEDTGINSNNGNSMLRRSSRFKSRSDLEEIAHSSALVPTGASSARRNSGPGSRSSTLAATAISASGYGTDSMAEDGSGDNSTTRGHNVRLRQRMGRPMSGLSAAHGHGYGGIGARKKTLVLDLDETLIHSTSRGSRSQGYMVEVLVDRHACLYYVYKRPHVDYFLKKVSEWYKLVIYTASMAEYADPVIDWLDQSRTLFDKRYFRQACYFRNGSYLKDLTVIDQDLSSVCLLDNSPISYSLNKENGIPIDSWIDDPNDEALLDLLPFLDALRFTEDVRSVLSLRTI